MSPQDYVQQKAAASGSSFYYAFLFLSKPRRAAITAFYAFCREVDDVVDECTDLNVARTRLAWWRIEVAAIYEGKAKHPVAQALAALLPAFKIEQPRLQEIIDGMEAVHDFSLVAGLDIREPAYVAEMKRRNPPVIHKCVIVHPVTGRKFLFIGDRVRNFVGMTEEESKPFIQMYVRHATRAEHHYRHQWRVGDLIMWQNRYTMHYAPADFDQSQPRDMQRTTIIGDSIGRLVRPRQAA